jgi:A/G-specific adenine glycosylase
MPNKEFSELLLKWYKIHGRKRLLWRLKKDPFGILISELMLQKTKVKMVEKVYPEFIKKYNMPQKIYNENVRNLCHLLKPLGLQNRRARDIKKISRVLVDDYNGKVPNTFEKLVELPGVGVYIANTVLCFAFGKKVPLVDSNVAKLLKILYKIEFKGDLDKNKHLWKLISNLLPNKNFKKFNQALLDFSSKITQERIHDEFTIHTLKKLENITLQQ